MRRLTALFLLALAATGCTTTSADSVTGTIRTPRVIYSQPGQP